MLFKRKSFIITVVLLLSLALATQFSFATGTTASVQKISIMPYGSVSASAVAVDPSTLEAGSTFAAKVKVTNATQLQGVDLILEYSKDTLEVETYIDDVTSEQKNKIYPGVVNAVKADEGTVDSALGTVSIGVANASPADYADAVVMNVGFKVIAGGPAYVRFKEGGIKLATAGGSIIDLADTVKEALTFNIAQAPVPVSDFANTAKTDTTATFTWTAVADATGIVIQQSPAEVGNWTTAATGTISPGANTATVTGLTASTAYDFRLVVTGGQNAGNSNVVSLTTSAAPERLAELQLSGTLPVGFKVGDSFDLRTLTLTGMDQNGQTYPVDINQVIWESSDTDVAEASGSNLIGIGAGPTGITATIGDISSNQLAVQVLASGPDTEVIIVNDLVLSPTEGINIANKLHITATAGEDVNWEVKIIRGAKTFTLTSTQRALDLYWPTGGVFSEGDWTVNVKATDTAENIRIWEPRVINVYKQPVKITDVRVLNSDGDPQDIFQKGDMYLVEASVMNYQAEVTPLVLVKIFKDGVLQYMGLGMVTLGQGASAKIYVGPTLPRDAAAGQYNIEVSVLSNWLKKGGISIATPHNSQNFTVN